MTAYDKLVSIVVPTFNRRESVKRCVESLLRQTYKNIEIIVADDGSSDETPASLRSFNDKRLKVLILETNKGPSAARNAGILSARGEIIFFTDDDVVVPKDWVEITLPYLESKTVVGVEGKIIYVDDNYKAVYSDRIVQNSRGGQYMTANAAYKKEILLKTSGFDLTLRKFQDRDLALRARQYGKIVFLHESVVYHSREAYTVSSYMFEAKKVKWWILLYKRHKDTARCRWIVYEPLQLIAVFFPFVLFGILFRYKFRTKRDWLLFLLSYPRLVYERGLLWRAALKEKTFII